MSFQLSDVFFHPPTHSLTYPPTRPPTPAETETTTFTDCVNCLIAFTNNPHSLDVSLNAIAFLRFCAMALAEGDIGELEELPEGSLEAAGVAWANSNSSSATFRCQQCRRSGVLHLRHLPRPRRRRHHLPA